MPNLCEESQSARRTELQPYTPNHPNAQNRFKLPPFQPFCTFYQPLASLRRTSTLIILVYGTLGQCHVARSSRAVWLRDIAFTLGIPVASFLIHRGSRDSGGSCKRALNNLEVSIGNARSPDSFTGRPFASAAAAGRAVEAPLLEDDL